ncbi:Disulfide-bond oxidoreductase YfcG [Agrobacterium sp. DSM 25558]|uniref:glutathione S-transferase family protein n=1 Tax=Agrobacterium sp. DSM 25558 TaxID=1907665 RepID=UPI0009724911|nr:glutathione S-transferase family protein [Agrobacterium sp. DSM 25558]SCX22953.1 Disulfide-bond oxidoreductase YfcG [Agrobacterium sp. DSM 25558]
MSLQRDDAVATENSRVRPDEALPLRLYGNRNSGHSYKVALFLQLSAIDYEYVHINLDTNRAHRPAAFRRLAKFDEVPIVVYGDIVLSQSNAILLYLSRKLRRYEAMSEYDQELIHQWLFWEANRIGFSLSNLRHIRRLGLTEPELEIYYSNRTKDDLDRLNQEFSQGEKSFLIGERPTIADISCCGYLFWAREAEINVDQWPAVSAWLSRIRALPGWIEPSALMAARNP